MPPSGETFTAGDKLHSDLIQHVSSISVQFPSKDKKCLKEKEKNNTYILLFACYMVINTTVPFRFHVFQADFKKRGCPLQSHSNIEHLIQATLFCIMNIFWHTLISFFFKEIDCNHPQKTNCKIWNTAVSFSVNEPFQFIYVDLV